MDTGSGGLCFLIELVFAALDEERVDFMTWYLGLGTPAKNYAGAVKEETPRRRRRPVPAETAPPSLHSTSTSSDAWRALATTKVTRTLSSRQAQHYNVLAAQGFQALRQLKPGIDTIVEQPHIAAQPVWLGRPSPLPHSSRTSSWS